LNPTAEHFSITMRSIAAEAASITASLILGTGARASMMAESMVEMEFLAGAQAAVPTWAGQQVRSMELVRRTAPSVLIPEPSVA
jgi:hypothetical protein